MTRTTGRRSPKHSGELRTKLILVRFSPTEKAQFERFCADCGRSKAEIARSIILEVIADDAREHAGAAG